MYVCVHACAYVGGVCVCVCVYMWINGVCVNSFLYRVPHSVHSIARAPTLGSNKTNLDGEMLVLFITLLKIKIFRGRTSPPNR